MLKELMIEEWLRMSKRADYMKEEEGLTKEIWLDDIT